MIHHLSLEIYPEDTLSSSNQPYYYGIVTTLFGEALLIIRGNFLLGFGFTHEPKNLISKKWPEAPYIKNQKMIDDLWNHTSENGKIFCVLYGTSFQKAVWDFLLQTVKEQTVSYQDIAFKINRPKAMRAVGSAVGANPLSYLIPCHRVILSNGKIGDYRWGVNLKKRLIQFEGAP